jgi:hypothetical protein
MIFKYKDVSIICKTQSQVNSCEGCIGFKDISCSELQMKARQYNINCFAGNLIFVRHPLKTLLEEL